MEILFAQGAGGLGDVDAIMKMIMAYMVVVLILGVIINALIIVSFWMIFAKAGEPGWASIVPIYNYIVMLKIAGKPTWWILLFLCPPVGIIANIIVLVGLAKNFGQSTGFALGLIFLWPIFLPMLAFGSSRYEPVDEEGRPMKRRRSRDDDDDDDEDDRPRRRSRDDDDDDDDRPSAAVGATDKRTALNPRGSEYLALGPGDCQVTARSGSGR